LKKLISILTVFTLLLTFAACGGNDGKITTNTPSQPELTSQPDTDTAKGEVYFLNFKPEVGQVYEEIAKEYEQETGVRVKVVTAASDTYEQTLTSEIAKSSPPTIFQLNGPVGYENWKSYCADLKDTKLYSILTDKSMAITNNGGVYGIPYVVEGYGIIYNEDITDRYFALETKSTDLTSMEQVNSFEKLKALVEDMTKHKTELGIDGVFASTSFAPGNQWRWNTHLLNVPFHYEMDEIDGYDNSTMAGLSATEFPFAYEKAFRNILDLYLSNSVTEKKLIGSKSVSDSMAEFALGKAAMVQNGSWAYAEISQLQGNTIKADKVKMLPIYMGLEDEENQGLCIGTEGYLAINSKASSEDQKASADFLYWLFSSEKGKRYVTEELGFVTPFNTMSDVSLKDPLANEVLYWSNKDDIDTVPWAFTSFPGIAFKDEVGSALLDYAQGTRPWEETAEKIRDAFKKAKAK
jgi:raffinose/stachyose/melibiose transport system substrate-binding protein